MFNTLPYPLEYPFGVKQPFGNGSVVIRRPEAENIGVEYQLCPHACTKRIPVDAYDSGKGATIGIKGRGTVVGLDLKDYIKAIVKADNTCIVLEYRQTPVIRSKSFADLLSPLLDICIKEAVNYRLLSKFVFAIYYGVKDLVFTVL